MRSDKDIDWSNPAAPRSRTYGDIYYSLEDGLEESRAVFLAGCGLPEAWAGRRRFTVAELGFGSGLNVAALLTLWRAQRPKDGHLSIFSLEAHPMSPASAGRALAAWPEISEARSALASQPPAMPGFHRLDLPHWGATLDLAIGDAAWALEQWSGAADSWFLDGFSPASNPAMWSDTVFDAIRARSAPGARVATFTVAGSVRRALAARGFVVEKKPGHGRKRERLAAQLSGDTSRGGATPEVLIIGAGVAAASLARAFLAAGLAPSIVAPTEHSIASGFPAALVTPRFDLGDAETAALNAQALERAASLYDATPDAVLERGVLRLEHLPRDARRLDAVAVQPIWGEGAMRRMTADEADEHLGDKVGRGGLMMAKARAVRPTSIRKAWLTGVRHIKTRVGRVTRAPDGRWRLLDVGGVVIGEADIVVLASGWEVAALAPTLRLGASRGQASWARLEAPPPATSWGGYAVGVDGRLMFGATHQRGRTDVGPQTEDDATNLATLASTLPCSAARVAGAPIERRAAVRATTPDHLPLCGEVEPGLWVLGGLGSRGFLMAPLLAEHVAATVAGSPSPLPRSLARRLDPARFSQGPA